MGFLQPQTTIMRTTGCDEASIRRIFSFLPLFPDSNLSI